MATFRFPSKTFLLGEYAVLKGSNALLLGHAPFFTASVEPAGAPESPFHPESPAGKWLAQNPAELRIRFQDPHAGRGGFGGSGAEYLAAWVGERRVPAPDAPRAIFAWSAWEDSRTVAGVGSGADVLTQAFGVNRDEPFFLEIDLVGRSLREIYPRRHQGCLSLFHTGRKLDTHAAAIPDALPVEEMEDMVLRAGSWLESGHFEGFAREVNAYAEKLAALGLVAPYTAEAVAAARKLPGVLAAKGCGAMGADVILVAHEETADPFADWATANSLAEIGRFSV